MADKPKPKPKPKPEPQPVDLDEADRIAAEALKNS